MSPVTIARSAATKPRESSALRNIGSAFLRRSARGLGPFLVAPFAIVLIAPKVFLDDDVHDVVRSAVDEARVVFKELLDGLFDLYFERNDGWCFLNQWHGGCPFLRDSKSAPSRFGDFSAAGFASGFPFKFLISQCLFSTRSAEAGEDGGAKGNFCVLHCFSSALTPLLPAAFKISASNST